MMGHVGAVTWLWLYMEWWSVHRTLTVSWVFLSQPISIGNGGGPWLIYNLRKSSWVRTQVLTYSITM